jgi:Holliday junction resolvase RusA-like endonuclease
MARDSLYDYLDAVAASFKRRLWLQIETPELLRTHKNRAQAMRQEPYLELACVQIREQMRTQRRRAFRGDVSVEIDISALGVAMPPSAPKSVKRYLDAMSGLVYADDRQVAHLAVQRIAKDDPRWRDSDADGQSGGEPRVAITVLPVRLYVADYDRAFRLHDKIERNYDYDAHDEGHELWAQDWSIEDGMRLDDLRAEQRDLEAKAGGYRFLDEDLAARLASHTEREISQLQAKLMLHRRPQAEDRPGTREEWDWSPEMLKHFPTTLEPPAWMPRYDMPGEFWIPLPPEVSGGTAWRRTIRAEMEKHRERWRILPAAFDSDLSLDVAVLGAGTNARDIDNAAHDVLTAVEDLYCRARRGTVTGYRVYRCPSEIPGVRVRMMMGERIPQLARTLETARWYVISRGPRGDS